MTYKAQLAFSLNGEDSLVIVEPPEELGILLKRKNLLLKKIQKKETEVRDLESKVETLTRMSHGALHASMDATAIVTQEIDQIFHGILTKHPLSKYQRRFIMELYENILGYPYARDGKNMPSGSVDDEMEGSDYHFDFDEDFGEEFDDPFSANEIEPRVQTEDERKIRKTFLQLAGKFHPDLATNDTERKLRTGLMAELNAAYEQKNLAKILLLEKEHSRELLPKSFESVNHIKEQIEKISSEITILEGQLKSLTRSCNSLRNSGDTRELLHMMRRGVPLEELHRSIQESLQEPADKLKEVRDFIKEFAEGRMSWKKFECGPQSKLATMEDFLEEELFESAMIELLHALSSPKSSQKRNKKKRRK